MEKSQNQIKNFENEFERQKSLLLNSTHNQDERYTLISKKYDELNDLMQMKINENKNLFEKNLQLENNFKEIREILQEKNQQIDQLNKQLESLQIEYEEFQINFNQIKEEKNKLINEINLLMNNNNNNSGEQIVHKENEKLHQTINELNEKIQKQHSDPGENIQVKSILSRFLFYQIFLFIGIERKISKNENFINTFKKRITRKKLSTETKFN